MDSVDSVDTVAMDTWARRGQIILGTVLVVIVMVYLLERLVFHSVIGTAGLLQSGILFGLILLVAGLTYLGIRGVRWLLGVFLILNSLGVPVGIEQVFGGLGAGAIILFFLVVQVGSALVLCFAPGIASFMRYQRQRRDTRVALRQGD